MVTIIKVKRKITEDPADCLIIECKKMKNDSSADDSIKQILKYAGTAKTENDIPDKLNELNKNIRKKEDLQNEYKSSKTKNIKENSKNDAKLETKSQRYVLLNKKRGLNEENEDINIIDVISSDYLNDLNDEKTVKQFSDKQQVQNEQQITCNGVPLVKEKINKNDFIYDIYYARNDETYLDLLYANNYNIKSCSLEEDELVNKNDNCDEYFQDDDDDSNDENNWRNDYPDEDEDGNINDYYDEYDHDYDEFDHRLSNMMKKSCTIDNYDDDYYNDSNYYNDEDDDDDNEYNYESQPYSAFDKYKKKILKELNDDDF